MTIIYFDIIYNACEYESAALAHAPIKNKLFVRPGGDTIFGLKTNIVGTLMHVNYFARLVT